MVLKTRALPVRQRTHRSMRCEHLAEWGSSPPPAWQSLRRYGNRTGFDGYARARSGALRADGYCRPDSSFSRPDREVERAILLAAKHDEYMRRLTTFRGVGAIAAARPSRRACRIPAGSSRLATLPAGWAPRSDSSGGNERLGPISKMGIRNSALFSCRDDGRPAGCPKQWSGTAMAEGASRQTTLQGCRRPAGE